MVSAPGLHQEQAVPPVNREGFGNLGILPPDVILQCLAYLSPQNLAVTALVSRQLRALSHKESLWKLLFKRDFPCQPEEQPYKLHYQTCFNIKKGRFAVRIYMLPGAVCFQGNQSIHRFPRETQQIIFPPGNSDICFPLPPAADLKNLFLEWNGKQLAVACLDDGIPSVQIYSNPTLKNPQILPMRTIGFLWYGDQLVTASVSQGQVVIQIWGPDQGGNLQVMYSCAPEGTQGVIDDMNLRETDRVVYADSEFYESLAWDGTWLAFRNRDERDENDGVYIWKVNEGKLVQEEFLQEPALSDFLRWKGNLLFIRMGSHEIKIWDRVQKAYCQKIDCLKAVAHKDVYNTEIEIHGNQLFVAHANTLSLWESDANGTYTLSYNTFLPYVGDVLNFHRSGLYVKMGFTSHSMLVLDFAASHRDMLASMRGQLKHLIEYNNNEEENMRFGFRLLHERLLRMPTSKTKPLLQELEQIQASRASKRADKNYSQLPFNPLQLAQAIDTYLIKTKSL